MGTDTAMATMRVTMRAERGRRRVGVPRTLPLVIAAALASCWSLPAAAQQVRVEPNLQLGLTWSDNVGATSSGKESGFVAEVSPGLSISRQGGRISGRLDLSLRNQVDTADSGRNSTYLALNGRGEVEAVEDLLFVDFDAAISRDNPSLFLGRSRGDALNTDSDNEVRTLGIAPRLEFRLGDTAATLRYQARWLDGADTLSRQRLGQWSARAGNATAFGYLGWGVDYTRSDTSYGSSGSRDVRQEVARATLFVNVTPQVRLRLIGGRESNDYALRRGESGSISGLGFDWIPTPRTSISGVSEKRIFGRGHDLRIEHRGALSAWELGWSRDITSSLESVLGLYNDPLFRQLYDALETTVPDPVEREQVVRQLLQALGYGTAGLRDTVVTNNYYLDRRLRAGFSLIGARNVLSFSLTRSDRERLGGAVAASPLDELAAFDRVRENSATLGFSHRLSGLTSLNAGLTRSRVRGGGPLAAETRRTLFSLGLSTRLGPKTTGALSYRYQKAAGSDRFVENAITATLFMRF